MDDSVVIVTLTRGRQALLRRAIASLTRQDYHGPIHHLVVIDDCDETLAALERGALWGRAVTWHAVRRPFDRGSFLAPHLAALRNLAVGLADSRWIGFLDDDNEYEPNHISSLVKCATVTGARAVHSHECIFHRDGRPYLKPLLPWSRDQQQAAREYQRLVRLGVFVPGSNISRDRVDPLDVPDSVRSVDMGEWLFERALLLRHPFDERYTEADQRGVVTEDDKLMDELVRARVSIACTGVPTLRYYLGGFSNAYGTCGESV